jgi:hypothetical protein
MFLGFLLLIIRSHLRPTALGRAKTHCLLPTAHCLSPFALFRLRHTKPIPATIGNNGFYTVKLFFRFSLKLNAFGF